MRTVCFSAPEQTKVDSFRRQTTQTVEFCQKHNLALNKTRFEDLGMSGSALSGQHESTSAFQWPPMKQV
jgi:hypothetical protein